MTKVIKDVFEDYKRENNIVKATILKMNLYKKSNKLELNIESQNQLVVDELTDFESYLMQRFAIKTIKIEVKYLESVELKNTLDKDWTKIRKYIATKFPVTKAILTGSSLVISDNSIIINLKSKSSEFLHAYSVDKVLESLFLNLYGKKYKVEYKENITEDDIKEQQHFLEELQDNLCKNMVNDINVATEKKKEEKLQAKKIEEEDVDECEEETPLIIGRSANIKEQIVKIKDLTPDYGKVALQGKVIRTDSRELKNGKTLVMFDVYDGTSTITCKSFVEPDKVQKVMSRIKKGIRVKLQGNAQYDNFAKEIGVIANIVIELPPQEEISRKDNSINKRVELHLHTQMSQMDAVTAPKDLIKRAATWGMKAIAITDHGVVQAFPEAKHTIDDLGLNIKVIYGVEAYFVPDDEIPDEEDGWKKVKPYHAIILTKTQKGLRNLYELISVSHIQYYHKRPRVLQSVFEKYREGLILGSACEQGELYRAILHNKGEEKIEKIAKYYDYFEIQPLGNDNFLIREGTVPDEEALKNINRKIVELGEKHNKLVVATCDVHFMDPQDEVYRRILMAGQGFSDCDNQAPLYLRTTEEMLQEFEYLGQEKAYEVVVTNTNKIADSIEEVCPISKEKCPPVIEGAEEEIKETCENKAKELYGDPLPEIVKARLERELDSIIKNGFSTLYIIAQRLVLKSNADGYLVGSRGSVGSSFVANMLGITEVNSLPPHYRCPECKYSDFTDYGIKNGVDLPDKKCPKCGADLVKDGMDIPFETFLGFNGDKEPDIDLNFSGEYQGKIHRYAEVIFGKGKTFKAGTVGTIAEKTAFGYVKNYYEERHIPITNAEISRIVDGCVGIKRTTGQHPGGIIVVPHGREIYEFCPVQHPADDPNSDIITTHFDYHSIDKNLLKLDMLGHDDPTVIRMLQDLTGIDPKTIPLDDKETMSLFTSTDALGVKPEQINSRVGSFGVPEFGTKFVREMLIDTKPTTFEELIRISRFITRY